MSADLLVAEVRRRGSDARDARDAAHEACHALQWSVPEPWSRENIHKRKPRLRRADGVTDEIMARAVEQLVCADLGYDCGSVEKWAMVCWMEMLKNERISLPGGSWLEDRIRDAMKRTPARELADKVLGLIP